MKFFCAWENPIAMDSFVQVQQIPKHLITEDIRNSKNMSYQLQNRSLWRRGWLVWMWPLVLRPLLSVEDCHSCLASPCTALISPMHLQELRRHWSAVMHTQGLGLTLAYQGFFAKKYLQPQKGLFLWPDIEWGGATTWDLGAQILNQVFLQVKRNLFSISWQRVFHRSCVFFWRQVFCIHIVFFTRQQVPKLLWLCPLLHPKWIVIQI